VPRPGTSAAAPSGADVPLDRRALAFALSAAIHAAALAALLLWHFAPSPQTAGTALTVVEVPEARPSETPKPPPPPPQPHPTAGAPKSGAAAPAGRRAEAAPIAAAVIPVTLPSFTPALVPSTGTAPSSGAALAGSGTGAGGSGNGTGGGGNGNGGSGGAGEGTSPEIVRGDFKPSDYPKSLREAGPQGRTWTEVTVGVNGRPLACRVTQSSGTGLLDTETCRIIMQRFRFRPGRDAAGKVVQAPFYIDIQWEYRDLDKE